MHLTANRKIFAAISIIAIATVIFFTYSMQNEERNETGQNEIQNNASLNNKSLDLVQSISLSNVSGRIDHMDIDIIGQRLFVSELGNNSVDIIDLKTGKRINSISGVHEPQGIVYVQNVSKIFVANGGDGTVQNFDSNTFSLVKTIPLSSDADNMHYEKNKKLVYVGFGNG